MNRPLLLALHLLAAACTAHAQNVATGVTAPTTLHVGAGTGKAVETAADFDACKTAAAKRTPGKYRCKSDAAILVAKAPPVVVTPPAPPPVATEGYVKCADENASCSVKAPSQIIYGAGATFTAPKAFAADLRCDNTNFSDPIYGVAKACWLRVLPTGSDPTPPVMSYTGPFIDLSKIPTSLFSSGTKELQLRTTSEVAPDSSGEFRTSCQLATMAKDDPVVFPGKPGASHLHTVFGNTGFNAYSTPESLRKTGSSTCRGGMANGSAYWVPTMIDTLDGTPLAPDSVQVYYKSGFFSGDAITQGIPEGLRIVAGNPLATGPSNGAEFSFRWKCLGGPNNENDKYGESIPNCDVGAQLWSEIFFPQCWDGRNLDSPNHKSHMSFGETAFVGGAWIFRCPSTHPVSIPQIAFNIVYLVPPTGTKTWRLSSDLYDPKLPGGYSSHGDWFNGWQPDISDAWFNSCLKAKKDCHSHLLGDGREIY